MANAQDFDSQSQPKGSKGSPVVNLKDVSFTYPRSTSPALQVREFSIGPGEKVFLRGPSGMGKTTLLGVVAGVNVPQHGVVRILGQDLMKLSSGSRDSFRGQNIGYIFQLFNLIPYLNVIENVLIHVEIFKKRTPELVARAWVLLEKLGLKDHAQSPVTELSVGQQQRVAAARALVSKPALVIADEPTSALDSELREAFLDVLFELCNEQGSALLFVSHDTSLHGHFDRVVELKELNLAIPSASGELK